MNGAPAAGLVGLALAALVLSACSDVRQAVGMDRRAPDEFAVVSRAPLSLPPDYDLRPPDPGAPRPQDPPARIRAEAAVLTSTAAVNPGLAGSSAPGAPHPGRGAGPVPDQPYSSAPSAAEARLLGQAGASQADPTIRRTVETEAAAQVAADRGLVDRLIFWRSPAPSGTVVDPQAEARRLANNQALGRPVNEGDVPVIERRRRGLLQGIIN